MKLALRKLLLVSLTLLAALAFCQAASACPGCKEAVAGDGEEGVSRAGIAFSVSVLFMLSMPFLLVAGFGTAFYCLYRKQQALQRQPTEEGAEEKAQTHP